MPVIKKYENRRLYDTEASRYVNLDDIARMVAEDVEISVMDVKTGRDLTREVLLQIVLESGAGADLFPVPLLRRVIRAGGTEALPRMVREQLVIGLDLLEAQLAQSESYLDRLYEPVRVETHYVAEPSAFGAWGGAGTPRASSDEDVPARRVPSALDAHGGVELDELRAQLARLEERLKR